MDFRNEIKEFGNKIQKFGGKREFCEFFTNKIGTFSQNYLFYKKQLFFFKKKKLERLLTGGQEMVERSCLSIINTTAYMRENSHMNPCQKQIENHLRKKNITIEIC